MGSLAALVKVQVYGAFGIGRLLHSRDARERGRLVISVLGAILLVVLIVTNAWSVASALVHIGATDALPSIAVAAVSLGCAVTTFIKANGLLFGFKDFDLVVTMPVPLWQVVVSRVAPLYGMGLATSLVMGAPIMERYIAAVGAPAATVAVAAVVLVLAPLIPIALALALSFCVAWVASRTPFAKGVFSALGALATVALVIGISAASRQAGDSTVMGGEAFATLGRAMGRAMGLVWPPAAWAAKALAGDAVMFCLYVGGSVVLAWVALGVLTHELLGMNALLSSGAAARFGLASSGHTRDLAHAPRTPLVALTLKELRLWVGTPIYFVNTAVGPALTIIIAIVAAVLGPGAVAGTMGVSKAGGEELAKVATLMLPWALAFCTAMTSISASSVSLEGSSRWVMQTAPVADAIIVRSKMALNLALTCAASLVAGLVVAFCFARGPLEALLCVVAPLSGGAISSCLGVFADVKRPRFDWSSEYEPVKRSTSVLITVGVGMAVVLAGGTLTLGAGGVGAGVAWALVVLVVAALLKRSAERTSLADR